MIQKIVSSMTAPIRIEGPVPCSADSHPFCSMSYCRKPYSLDALGYKEEEYFIDGRANVYEADEEDRIVIKAENIPYKNRMIVRYPKEETGFSGRVYLDILNATNGYDHEDLWSRIFDWCVENGHAYIGLTSKPINVAALKQFDYKRYKSLNWASGASVPQPAVAAGGTIPGTEEGLFWDMISQLVSRMRFGESLFPGWHRVKYIYLTGQSQSGAYLNTYVHYFDPVIAEHLQGLIDGYFNIVGAQIGRELCQQEEKPELTFDLRRSLAPKIPMIAVASEGDFGLFRDFGMEDLFRGTFTRGDDTDSWYRYYEIPGASHFDITCSVLPADEDIIKAGRQPHQLSEINMETLSDLSLEIYVQGLLDRLHAWAAEGCVPPDSKLFVRDGIELVRDEFDNVKGGLRNPYVDVPTASYHGAASVNRATGEMVPFTRQQFDSLYDSPEDYLKKFTECAKEQVSLGWIDRRSYDKLFGWAKKRAELYR